MLKCLLFKRLIVGNEIVHCTLYILLRWLSSSKGRTHFNFPLSTFNLSKKIVHLQKLKSKTQ